LASYGATVLTALVIHAVVTLPLLLRLVAHQPAHRHARIMSPALLTAFSTRSSSATLPLTLTRIEKGAGVSNRISSFVLPLGATVNMDGTALYECVAALFIAQAYGVALGFTTQLVVVLTALLASIGAAGIPAAGLVMISIILEAVGLPLEGVALILAIDPVLDMCRTCVNVWSDSCGALAIASTEGESGLLQNRDNSEGSEAR
jgi:Na+/H+-dicarboxylate symporter